MINLIQVGVDTRRPCRRPDLQIARRELGKGLNIRCNRNVKAAVFVEPFRRFREHIVGRVVFGFACNREHEFKRFSFLADIHAVRIFSAIPCRLYKRANLLHVARELHFVVLSHVLAVDFRIRPRFCGHRTVNRFRQIGRIVIFHNRRSVHSFHNRLAHLNIGHGFGVNAHVAVAIRRIGYVL